MTIGRKDTGSSTKFKLFKENLERTFGRNSFLSKAQLQILLEKKMTALTAAACRAAPTADSLEKIRADIGDCKRCKLCEDRTNIVFGEGNPKARLMFIGEAPGQTEDETGRPFVGRGGQLLGKIIEAMGYKREDVYIGNVVKCRPPDNRRPERDEVEKCEQFLFRQIDLIGPRIIVALGATALECLRKSDEKITQVRGKFLDYRGRQLVPTYHPAYLLRNPPAKKDVWEDMQKVMKALK